MRDTTKTAPPCPVCGDTAVVPIIYGLPTSEAFAMVERGEAALGGCVISREAPRWRCKACHMEFGAFFDKRALSQTHD
jgi:hypothetical protein